MKIEVDDTIANILKKEADSKGISTNTLLGDLLSERYQEFKDAIQSGFDDFNTGRVSKRTALEIAKAVSAKHL
jgi:predicted homoserine dehydrogenase-like protein